MISIINKYSLVEFPGYADRKNLRFDGRRLDMKTLSARCCRVAALLSLVAAAGTISASGPVAVYAIVDKVIFEPNETSPQRIQIWGAFSVAAQPYSTNYSPAQKGYLYYKLDRSSEQSTRATWADLKKVAGTGEAVGFGGGFSASGAGARVRKSTEKPDSPDAYPIGNPVVRLASSQQDVVARLRAAPETK